MGLRLNILAANDKNLVLNRENLKIKIPMDLSGKQKTFSHFPSAFLKSILNFEHFEKKDNPDRFCIPNITDSKNVVR